MAKITLNNIAAPNFGNANELLMNAAKMQGQGVAGLGLAATEFAGAIQKGNLAALEQQAMQAKTVNEFNNPEFQQGLQAQLASYGRSIDKSAANKLLDARPVTLAEQQSKLQEQAMKEAEWTGSKNAALVHQLQAAGKTEEANNLMQRPDFNTPEMYTSLQKLRQGDANLASTLASTANTQFGTYAAEQKLPFELQQTQSQIQAIQQKLAFDKEMQPLQRQALEQQLLDLQQQYNIRGAAAQEEYGNSTGGGGNFGMTQTGITGKSGSNANAAKYAPIIYDQYRRNGLSHAQASAMVAEHGRENDFNPEFMFGSHSDAANSASNIGIMSWQGSRNPALKKFMMQKGVWNGQGAMPRTEAALRAQVDFATHEMRTDGAYERTRREFLNNPNVTQQQAAITLGDNFIRWDRRGKVLGANLGKHLSKRDNYYAMANGYGGSQAQQLAEARDRASGRTGNPNKGSALMDAAKAGQAVGNKTINAPNKNRYITEGKATPQDIMAMLDLTPDAIKSLPASQQKAVKDIIKETHQLMQDSTLGKFASQEKFANFDGELDNWRDSKYGTTPGSKTKYERAARMADSIKLFKGNKQELIDRLGKDGQALAGVNFNMIPDSFWTKAADKALAIADKKVSEKSFWEFGESSTIDNLIARTIASELKQFQIDERRSITADVDKIIASQRSKLARESERISKANKRKMGI